MRVGASYFTILAQPLCDSLGCERKISHSLSGAVIDIALELLIRPQICVAQLQHKLKIVNWYDQFVVIGL